MVFVQKQKGEQMDDVISRKAAIDALRDAENHAFNSYYRGLIKAHKIIAGLPSAQPEQKTCDGCMWEDSYSYGDCPNCSRAYREDLYQARA